MKRISFPLAFAFMFFALWVLAAITKILAVALLNLLLLAGVAFLVAWFVRRIR